ncbi:MAG: hypothetical protein ACTS5R_01650 [Candidatus Hodgkinia cicadicola]
MFQRNCLFRGMAPLEDLSRRQLVERNFRFEMANESEQTCDSVIAKASTDKTKRSFQLLFDNAMTAR